MRQRSFIVVAVALAVLILGAVGVYAYDKTRDDVIAHGVTAGGVDIGGMNKAAAKRALDRQVTAALRQPIVVTYRHQRFKLKFEKATKCHRRPHSEQLIWLGTFEYVWRLVHI